MTMIVAAGMLVGISSFDLVVGSSGANPGPVEAPRATTEHTTMEHVAMELLSSVDSISPGRSFDVAVRFQIVEGWHMYWKNPGDSGMPPVLRWTLPPGFTVAEPEFPVPTIYTHPGGTNYIHEKELVLLVTINPPSAVPKTVSIELRADWLVCDADICLPESAETTLTLVREDPEVLPGGRQSAAATADDFARWREAIPASDEEALKRAKPKT